MVIEHTIKITLLQEGVDINRVEGEVMRVTEEAQREIFTKVLRRVEKVGLASAGVICYAMALTQAMHQQ